MRLTSRRRGASDAAPHSPTAVMPPGDARDGASALDVAARSSSRAEDDAWDAHHDALPAWSVADGRDGACNAPWRATHAGLNIGAWLQNQRAKIGAKKMPRDRATRLDLNPMYPIIDYTEEAEGSGDEDEEIVAKYVAAGIAAEEDGPEASEEGTEDD